MRLAELHGRLDVDAMLSELTPGQFNEWIGKMMLEPAGGWVDDERWSLMLTMLSHNPKATPAMFRFSWTPRPPTPTISDVINEAIRRQTGQAQ
jgi:hypothetical protein